MTPVANDRLALAVQRLTRVQLWFGLLSTKSRTPAEARARIEDAQAIADVLAHVREQPVEAALAVTNAAELRARIEAALSRDGKPRGDHMIGAYAAIAVSTLETDDDEHAELAGVYDAASRCIANETAMFDGLAALMPEVLAGYSSSRPEGEYKWKRIAQEAERQVELWKERTVAFLAPRAVVCACESGRPDGELNPAHYDMLRDAGARMDSFSRGEP